MDLVGVDADQHEEPDLPGQHIAPGRHADDRRPDEQQVPRAAPPVELGEVPRVVVVDDVRLDEVGAHDRGVLGAVGVFEPMDDAGHEVGEEDGADGLQ